ncbi:transposase IS200-family protein [Fischerella sp. NIES-4106]|nr:transposase IS200-family protein [Fischerella sp. NIES-4106]
MQAIDRNFIITLKMISKYRHKTTSVTLINYHFVWIPKRRKKVLIENVAKRLEELLYEKTKELDCEIIALEIMEDHVHLFLCCPPTLAPDQIMFRLKGFTSRVLRQEFPHLLKLPSMWTRSYFCSTAGDASSETIKRYIANQKTR